MPRPVFDQRPPHYPPDRWFRYTIGLLAMVAGLAGFIALFAVEIPPRNENALMFALGVIFGWGSAVVGSEFGTSTIGRRVAEVATRQAVEQLDRNRAAQQAASDEGDDDDAPSPPFAL